MHPDDGYLHARTLLADRFGNNYKVSDAWIKKVTEGPAIQNNPKRLRDFADQLKTCAETLTALGMLHEMSSRSELVKVIERLPFHLKSRWLRHVKTIRDMGRSRNICDAVEFIMVAAEELNDPIFGALVQGGHKTGQEFADKLHVKGRCKVVSVSTLERSNSTMRCEAVTLRVQEVTAR
ncbi:uncharacterized protein [Diadema setosum]|uniref:uncharacterized protein n=1 Tax=Diadema setosum TaxID=31175 RepID=UPI003B3A9F4D